MKISRPLSILLCILIFVFSFSLSVSSASDDSNLINPDLTEWEVFDSLSSDSAVVKWSNGGGLYRFYGKGDSSAGALLQVYYDLGNIISGHSYTFSFHLPDLGDIQAIYDTTMTDEVFKGYYNDATLSIGYGFLNPDGSSMKTSYPLFEFNSDNINAFVGEDLKASFVAPSSSGRPCIFICINANDTKSHYFFLQDFYLVDNDDKTGELKGIIGVLHSIRWDIVGGVCTTDDCPHSDASNPHLSLTERMSAGFQTFFDSLGTSIFNLGEAIGDKLNFNFSESILNFNQGFVNVGNWFSDLGNRISGFFSSLTSDIKARFSELWSNLSSWLDKFKPRVYFHFNWFRGSLNPSTGAFTPNDNASFVYVTDFFVVRPEDSFYAQCLDFPPDSALSELGVYKYSLDGTYLSMVSLYPTSNPYKLEGGYQYRFRYSLRGNYEPNLANDYVLVYADEGWVNAMMRCFSNLFLYLSWSEVPENPFESAEGPLDFVEGFFDGLIEYLSDLGDDIQNIIDSITGPVYLLDEFTKRFSWLLGILVSTLLLIVVTRFIGL